jgi:hypothetical protein
VTNIRPNLRSTRAFTYPITIFKKPILFNAGTNWFLSMKFDVPLFKNA